MIVVEYPGGFFQVVGIFGVFIPGKVEHQVEVIVHHRIIRSGRVHAFQFLDAFAEHFPGSRCPFFVLGFLEHFFHFGRVLSTQFVLDGLHLLLQEILPLLFVEFGAGLIGYFVLQFRVLQFGLHEVHQQLGSRLDVVDLQQPLFLLNIAVEVAAHEVDQEIGVFDVA